MYVCPYLNDMMLAIKVAYTDGDNAKALLWESKGQDSGGGSAVVDNVLGTYILFQFQGSSLA